MTCLLRFPLPSPETMPKRTSQSVIATRNKTPALFAGTPLMQRVGFLIRRLHQIHVALFVQEVGILDITTIQFTALSMLYQQGEIDQSELATQIGMDRTNISDVVRRLLERGYVTVRINPAHGRRRLIDLTAEGIAFLKRVDQCASRAHARTVAALSGPDRELFAALLQRLVQEENGLGRSPLHLK
jgi:MarR family transcriptional regulator, lower aerobic nicotinate degradation pathway regulator